MFKLLKFLSVCLSGLSFVWCLGGALAAETKTQINQDPYPGIIGKDNRKILDTWESPWSAIGRINVAGYRTKSMCTGTLIAPDLVITAAHCLFDARTGKPHVASKVNFVAGVRRDQYLAHTIAKCMYTLPGYTFTTKPSLEQAAKDIAIVHLAAPLNIPVFPLLETSEKDVTAQLISAGYARDRPFLLAADKSCKRLKAQGQVWLTNCDTNYGGSGGPVIIKEEEQLRVAAIMVGSVQKRYSIAVPITSWRRLLNRSAACYER